MINFPCEQGQNIFNFCAREGEINFCPLIYTKYISIHLIKDRIIIFFPQIFLPNLLNFVIIYIILKAFSKLFALHRRNSFMFLSAKNLKSFPSNHPKITLEFNYIQSKIFLN